MLDARPPADDQDAPPITVRVVDGHVVITPRPDIDRTATITLTAAIDAALAADAVAVVDLGDAGDHPDASTRWRPAHAAERLIGPDLARATASTGCGCIHLPAASSLWTVDIRAGRLCRSERFVDRRFIPVESWIPVRTIAICRTSLTALTTAGSYLVSARDGVGSPGPLRSEQ